MMENNMFKENLSILVSIMPVLVITFYASQMLDENYEEILSLRKENRELQNNCNTQYSNKISYNVTVTTYNPTRAQTDSTPNELADGTKIKPWRATDYRYVALSRDLIARWGGPFEYGDYIVIEGTDGWDGIYQVRDTMNPKWTNRVDILTTNSRFKYKNITMYKYVDEYEIVDNS